MFNGLKEKVFGKNDIKEYYILYSKTKLPLIFMKNHKLYENNILNFKTENKNDIQNTIINNIKLILKFTSNFNLNEVDEKEENGDKNNDLELNKSKNIPHKSTPIASLEYSEFKIDPLIDKLPKYPKITPLNHFDKNFLPLFNNIPLIENSQNYHLLQKTPSNNIIDSTNILLNTSKYDGIIYIYDNYNDVVSELPCDVEYSFVNKKIVKKICNIEICNFIIPNKLSKSILNGFCDDTIFESFNCFKNELNEFIKNPIPTDEFVKQYILKTYDLSQTRKNKIKFTNFYNDVIKGIEKLNSNISDENKAFIKYKLPSILKSLGLLKFRSSDGIYWYGIKFKKYYHNMIILTEPNKPKIVTSNDKLFVYPDDYERYMSLNKFKKKGPKKSLYNTFENIIRSYIKENNLKITGLYLMDFCKIFNKYDYQECENVLKLLNDEMINNPGLEFCGFQKQSSNYDTLPVIDTYKVIFKNMYNFSFNICNIGNEKYFMTQSELQNKYPVTYSQFPRNYIKNRVDLKTQPSSDIRNVSQESRKNDILINNFKKKPIMSVKIEKSNTFST